MSFESLQAKKVVTAAGLSQTLIRMSGYLLNFRLTGQNEKYREYLEKYANALAELLDLIIEQQKDCRHDQCNTLLDQERFELTAAISHVRKVAYGREELEEAKVREALATITSRAHSLPNLLNNKAA